MTGAPVPQSSLWSRAGSSLVSYYLPTLTSPDLNAVLQIWLHQHWRNEKSHLPQLAGEDPFNAVQDAVHGLCGKGILQAHGHLTAHQNSLILLCQAAFQPVSHQLLLVHGVIPLQGQDFAYLFAELHGVSVGPTFPHLVSMNSRTTICCIKPSS